MKFLLSIFSELSAGFVAALASVLTAITLLVIGSLYNTLWENPRIEKAAIKTARDGYVKQSKLEAAKANEQAANDLLELSETKVKEISEKLAGYDEAGHILKQATANSNQAKKDLNDEIEKLEKSRKLPADAIPTLDDLGILDQLQQR